MFELEVVLLNPLSYRAVRVENGELVADGFVIDRDVVLPQVGQQSQVVVRLLGVVLCREFHATERSQVMRLALSESVGVEGPSQFLENL